jgi:hypothetical protein
VTSHPTPFSPKAWPDKNYREAQGKLGICSHTLVGKRRCGAGDRNPSGSRPPADSHRAVAATNAPPALSQPLRMPLRNPPWSHFNWLPTALIKLAIHPGELARWVTTTHPESVNAGSVNGQRTVRAADQEPHPGSLVRKPLTGRVGS